MLDTSLSIANSRLSLNFNVESVISNSSHLLISKLAELLSCETLAVYLNMRPYKKTHILIPCSLEFTFEAVLSLAIASDLNSSNLTILANITEAVNPFT